MELSSWVQAQELPPQNKRGEKRNSLTFYGVAERVYFLAFQLPKKMIITYQKIATGPHIWLEIII